MRIGLVSYRCKNRDVAFNMRQIERAMIEAQGKAELLCFGEAFLQGFDSLSWDFGIDRDMAVGRGSETIGTLCRWTEQYGVALLTGYIEREDDRIYSSCIVIGDGRVLHNYRRISAGWKDPRVADAHYKEGTSPVSFTYRGQLFTLALCGDMFDRRELFKTDGVLLWPVYVSYTLEEWEECRAEYAAQAALAANRALIVNPIVHDEWPCIGGTFDIENGRIKKELAFGAEGILIGYHLKCNTPKDRDNVGSIV